MSKNLKIANGNREVIRNGIVEAGGGKKVAGPGSMSNRPPVFLEKEGGGRLREEGRPRRRSSRAEPLEFFHPRQTLW